MEINDYLNPLYYKLNNEIEARISLNLCAWSDLLGFGSHFTKTNWHISKSQWNTISNRLNNFYKICCQNHSPQSYMFMLNDGVIKTYFINSTKEKNIFNQIQYIEFWFREIVITQYRVNKQEKTDNFPGVRTVISFGEKLEYSFDEIKFDDYVINACRNDEGLSKLAKNNGNPTIISNPYPLQMNTALSKSYILDSLGSAKGISGNKIYIDESVFIYLKKMVDKTDILEFNERKNDEGKLFIIKYTIKTERPWLYAFLIDKEININEDKIKTKVYRVKAYYPADEHPDEFRFEL